VAHSSSLQLQHVDMQGERVVCDTSTGQPRPLIPVADRRDVFRAIHELAHAGIRATRRLMAAQVVWRGMASDVAAWCRDCQLCARGKASPQHTPPCVSRGVQVLVHYGGQVIQVAGSRPFEVHGG
jgi:hypothetical protein